MRRSRVILVLGAALMAVLMALLWMSAGITSLTASLFGSRMTASVSMEPYEIVLRTAFKGEKRAPPAADPNEWRLVLPRAFMVSEIGTNGAVYRANDGKNNPWWLGIFGMRRGDDFFVFLDTVVDPAAASLSPAVFAPIEALGDRFLGIHLTNSGTFPPVIADNYCFRQDDYDPALMAKSAPMQWGNCRTDQPRCQVATALDGWDIDLIVSRAMYDQPKKVCAVARHFLSEHTIRRDDVN